MDNKTNFATVIGLFVGLPILTVCIYMAFIFNQLTAEEESVFTAWSQVESNYQRRADLIPNLVATVSKYAEHEKEVLVKTAESRSQLSQAIKELSDQKDKANNLLATAKNNLNNESYLQDLQQSQALLGERISNIVAISENYPDLHANDNFLALQDQLEGTENRINVARMMFNDEVGEYNEDIRKFPARLIAGIGGFSRKAYFKAEEGSQKVIKVNF